MDRQRDLAALIASFVGTPQQAKVPERVEKQNIQPDEVGELTHPSPGSITVRERLKETDSKQESLVSYDDVPNDRVLRVLCFSKDRVFQLAEYLRTLHIFARGQTKLEVHILWTASTEEIAGLYESKLTLEYPWVNFRREKDFSTDVWDIVSTPGAEAILFGVDDAVFIRPLDIDVALAALREDSRVAVFHIKLARGMNFCHPAGRNMKPPPDETFHTMECGSVWSFPLGLGTYDWSYPWDLCGSLYRVDDAKRMLYELTPAERGHPNLLEMNGAKRVSTFFGFSRRAACYQGPQVMAVVTVNRVQDHYENAVYHNAETCNSSSSGSEKESRNENIDLNPFYGTHQFDLTAFQSEVFDRVHIGKYKLLQRHDVSVILPFRNSAACIAGALESIYDQDIMDDGPNVVELILVNDGSTDASLDAVRNFWKGRSTTRLPWRLINAVASPNEINQESCGVACALNAGIAAATGNIIFRMDADDVSSLERIRKQLEVLQTRQDLGVLGTGACKVRGFSPLTNFNDIRSENLVTTFVGEDFVNWKMYFSCVLVHPTVALRRSVALHMRGYRDGHPAEDYDLWLRCLAAGYKIDNIPDILLGLKISGTSVTGKRTIEESRAVQTRTSRDAWVRAGLVPASVSKSSMQALLFGESQGNMEDTALLIQALQGLEQQIIAGGGHEAEGSGKPDPQYSAIKQEVDDRIRVLAMMSQDETLWSQLKTKRSIDRLEAFRQLTDHKNRSR